jgi:hypothetical protein
MGQWDNRFDASGGASGKAEFPGISDKLRNFGGALGQETGFSHPRGRSLTVSSLHQCAEVYRERRGLH